MSTMIGLWWLWLIILIAIILLIIIIVVIVVVARKKDKDEEDETIPEPAAEPPVPVVQQQPVAAQPYQQPASIESDSYQPDQPEDPMYQPAQGPTLSLEPNLVDKEEAYASSGAGEQVLPQPTPAPEGLAAQPIAGYLPPAQTIETLEPSAEDPGEIPPPPPADGGDGLLEPPVAGGSPSDANAQLDQDMAALFGGTEAETPPPADVVPEILQISCHNCGEIMEITITERPVTIQCWNCQAEGMIE